MRRIAITLMTVALAASLSADDRRVESYTFDAATFETLHLDHAVGDLEIVDAPGSTIEIRMVAECDAWRCGDDVDDIELFGGKHLVHFGVGGHAVGVGELFGAVLAQVARRGDLHAVDSGERRCMARFAHVAATEDSYAIFSGHGG